jgi:tRNA U38,U39,U40 pseudouridine synthase TruA
MLQQQQQQGGGDGWPSLAVELVADRFLRRMVRVLVGTLVREAVAVAQAGGGGGREQLLQLVEGMDRRATAAAAPALGLCFAAVGYEEVADEPGA